VPRIAALLVALALPWAAAVARAADAEIDADGAVANATNAFEYRDFKKVIDVLKPWLHPPRIQNRDQRIAARRLLGVSLHVEGDVAGAREEFSQLLLEDPTHKLDPFVVPPPVIETFEAVRREMKPTLDRILRERGQRLEDPSLPRVVVVATANRFVALAPFGVPQFQLDEPGLGITFLSVQAAALAANVTGYFRAKAIHDAGGNDSAWLAVMYGGLVAFGVSWVASAILGNVELADYNKVLLQAPPRGAPPPGGVLTLTF
jgi:hypothetical protein